MGRSERQLVFSGRPRARRTPFVRGVRGGAENSKGESDLLCVAVCRLERLWCGRLYGPARGSHRGWLSLRKRRRNAGKCDSLSFLRVFLLQMDEVLGGTNGDALFFEGGWPAPLRELLFDPRQCVIRQASVYDCVTGVWWSRHWGQL